MTKTYGPQFFMQDGKLMFEHNVDDKTGVGPNEATDADIEANKGAVEAAEASAKGAVEAAKAQVKEAEERLAAISSAKGEVEKRAKDIEAKKKGGKAEAKAEQPKTAEKDEPLKKK